ncbi:hypothetical protein [Rhizobium leguminosarum]|uniref:hypothetical protein n=1 Tax=Rhizobium leguminosarum TaxID=384 RepID=UPI003F9678D7
MMPGSAIFPSNDIKAPGRTGGACAAYETNEGEKLNKFRTQTLASEKFHMF